MNISKRKIIYPCLNHSRIVELIDHPVKREIDQYLYSLHMVSEKNPANKKDISVDPLVYKIHEEIAHISPVHRDLIESFWNTPVDFSDPNLEINNSPFIVTIDTPMSKIHFLFTMLNINLLVVLEEGIVKGIITKLEFIQKRKSAVL